jgi:hypothetical protein
VPKRLKKLQNLENKELSNLNENSFVTSNLMSEDASPELRKTVMETGRESQSDYFVPIKDKKSIFIKDTNVR